MQQKLPDADDDSTGGWMHYATTKRAAMHAIPFPDYSEGYVGMAVYELTQDHTARIVDAESEA